MAALGGAILLGCALGGIDLAIMTLDALLGSRPSAPQLAEGATKVGGVWGCGTLGALRAGAVFLAAVLILL